MKPMRISLAESTLLGLLRLLRGLSGDEGCFINRW